MAKITSIVGLVFILMSGNLMAGDDDNVKITGDFRYRHEIIDVEDKDVRNRERIRARLYLEGKINDQARAVVGISSGSSDPVSNNQTLTGAFSSKSLLVDLAYFEIKPEAIKGLKVLGGKMKNPFFKPAKSELIWDSDIRQEGAKAHFMHRADNLSINALGSGLWIEERKDNVNSYLAGGQLYGTYHLDDKAGNVTIGGSYFKYGNIEGFGLFHDEDDSFGNSFVYDTTDGDSTKVYANEYELLQLFGAFTYKFDEIPVTVLGDFVTNTAADSLNTGWLAGLRIGKIKELASLEFRYIYRNVEKDAVVGIFADSDFRGGGTDAKGHEIGAGIGLMKNTAFAVTYFNNQIGLENDNQTNFQRWQIDLKFKF